MLVGVRDKEWEIGFVNNYCREQYQCMLEAVDELTELPDRVDAITDDESLESKEKLSRIRALQKEQRGLVRRIATIRADIVRELLETNGHEFDEKWWMRKTDADDMNTFTLTCLQKDVKENRPLKK